MAVFDQFVQMTELKHGAHIDVEKSAQTSAVRFDGYPNLGDIWRLEYFFQRRRNQVFNASRWFEHCDLK